MLEAAENLTAYDLRKASLHQKFMHEGRYASKFTHLQDPISKNARNLVNDCLRPSFVNGIQCLILAFLLKISLFDDFALRTQVTRSGDTGLTDLALRDRSGSRRALDGPLSPLVVGLGTGTGALVA